MTFNAMPQSLEDRKQASLAHAQQMLNIINSLGSYSENPLPQYDYGQATNQLNTDIGKNFAATLLMASGGSNNFRGGARTAAIQRRLHKGQP